MAITLLPVAAIFSHQGESAADAAFKIGLQYHNNNNLKAAAQHYRSALALDPALVSAAINLGIVYEAWRENETAEKFYGEAVRVAPRSFSARYNRGQFLQKKGNLGAARADYLVALELSPLEPSLYINLAAIEIKLFEKDRDVTLLKEAEKKLNTAERLKSKSPALYFNRAHLFELMNFPARARTFYEEAMRHYEPQSAEYQTCMLRAERLSRQLR
jgi:tetratricopeptide (TPR) repeat protein